MGFVDPRGSLDAGVVGLPLTRAQALESEHREEFLRAADAIAYLDHRVASVLGTGDPFVPPPATRGG
jgi:hypothetical protein